MRWCFWKKKEPTAAEVWADVCKEFSKLRAQLQEPEMRESLKSFEHGANGLADDLRETIEIIKSLFPKKW